MPTATLGDVEGYVPDSLTTYYTPLPTLPPPASSTLYVHPSREVTTPQTQHLELTPPSSLSHPAAEPSPASRTRNAHPRIRSKPRRKRPGWSRSPGAVGTRSRTCGTSESFLSPPLSPSLTRTHLVEDILHSLAATRTYEDGEGAD